MKIHSALVMLILSGLVLPLMGCDKSPQSSGQSSNAAIQVDFLFEHDGCKVYRFADGGHNIYYSKCSASSQTSWNDTQVVGKVVVTIPRQVTTIIVG